MQTRELSSPRRGAGRRRSTLVRRAASGPLLRPRSQPQPTWRRAPLPGHGWLWALPCALLAVWILRHFIEPLAWAAIVAIATWPMYRLFARRIGSNASSGVAAVAFTALVSVFVFVPMAFAFGALFAEAGRLVAWLQALDHTGVAMPWWLDGLPLVGDAVKERWWAVLGSPGGVTGLLKQAEGSALLVWAPALGRFVERHVFIGLVAIFALLFIFRSGESLSAVLRRTAEERLDPRANRFIALGVRAIRATVGGMVALALFDGVATGFLYAAAGVPRPAVWGAVTGLLAMLPFVGYAVVAGVGVGLAAHGAEWNAMAVVLAGSAVVFSGDKVLRPLLVGGAVELNLFWVLVGSIGGFQMLGLLGVFVGPVVLALCGEMWREWVRELPAPRYRHSDRIGTIR